MRFDVERERRITTALRRLAQATPEPPSNPDAEAALLRAFDAAWQSAGERTVARRHSIAARALAVAALVSVATVVGFVSVRMKLIPVRLKPDTAMARPDVDPGSARLQPDMNSDSVRRPQRMSAHRAVPPNESVTPPRRHAAARRRPPVRIEEPSEFVAWPGSTALPPLESGAFVRMDLPASVLPWLGMLPPAHTGVVQADVLVGQDGFARAIRLVPADQQRK